MNIAAIFKNALILALLPCAAFAQSVDVTHDMNFGVVSFTDNGTQRQIAFQTDGSHTADSQYYFLTNPVIAHVQVRDFTPNTPLIVTFTPDPGTLTPGTGSGTFSVDDYFTIPASVTTNGAGNVDFDVGAVLRSDGVTNTYNDTRFHVQVTVQVEEDI